jgi:hypothetical protein
MTTLLVAAILLLTTPLKPSYTKEEIRKEYDKVVLLERATYKDHSYFRFALDTSVNSIVTPFFRENYKLSEYLNTQYHQVVYEYHTRMKMDGSYKDLTEDSLQLKEIMYLRFLPLLKNYFNAYGSTIEIEEAIERPEIREGRLAGYATKFFFPDSIYSDGRVQSHICQGVNGFNKEPRDSRSVMMEAFTWSAIEPHALSGDLHDVFTQACKLANDLQLGSDPQTKIKRYQGVVWAYMSQSKVLRDLLLSEYEKKKHLLTFILKEN